MNESKNNISIPRRLASMLIDHFILCMIVGLASVSFTIPTFLGDSGGTPMDHMHIAMAIGFTLYLNKDIFAGRSPAKMLLGLQILDMGSGAIATPSQCAFRNITLIFWPIEVFVSLFSTDRRLGDRIAKTKVSLCKADTTALKLSPKSYIIPLVITYVLAQTITTLWLQPVSFPLPQ